MRRRHTEVLRRRKARWPTRQLTTATAVQHGSRRLGRARRGEELRRQGLDGQLDVVFAGLGGEEALGLVAVALALAVLLVGVLDGDFFVREVLAVHVGDGFVGGLEGGEGDEAVAFAEVGVVAGDLCAGGGELARGEEGGKGE